MGKTLLAAAIAGWANLAPFKKALSGNIFAVATLMAQTHILVAEDEEVLAEHLRVSLESRGYSVTTALRGEEAINFADKARPALALMDIQLEGDLDGIDAAHEIQRRFKIPVVFLTGFADRETFNRAKIASPAGYILKPCEGRELEICVEMTLYKHRMEQERESLIQKLQDALAKVKLLRGLLPICAYCKRVRDDNGYWTQVEQYVTEHSEATFNHGMCPHCFDRVKKELDALDDAGTGAAGLAGH